VSLIILPQTGFVRLTTRNRLADIPTRERAVFLSGTLTSNIVFDASAAATRLLLMEQVGLPNGSFGALLASSSCKPIALFETA
jgi:hypothetical protein